MKRVLIDVQTLQMTAPFHIKNIPLTGMIQALMVPEAGVEVHLLANAAFAKTLPALERLFPQVHAAGRLHVFHGLADVETTRATRQWRRDASSAIRDFCVADIQPDLVVLPDLFMGADTPLALGVQALWPCEILGFARTLLAVDAGPSRFPNGTARRAFLQRRFDLAGTAHLVIATSKEIADQLVTCSMGSFRERISIVPELGDSRTAPAHFAIQVLQACKTTRPPARTTLSSWMDQMAHLDQLQDQLINLLTCLPCSKDGVAKRDLSKLAQAMNRTRLDRDRVHRATHKLRAPPRWRLEGPFDSSYSLASVNGETALALQEQGAEVALWSSEGPGDYEPNPTFLAQHPALAILADQAAHTPAIAADVTSRNMFPPRVDDMVSPVNLLHGYAWEETGFPAAYVRDINTHLQGLLVTSDHVQRTLLNAGVAPPIITVGNGVDHLMIDPEPLLFDLPPARFTVLHVSSCFPRKGVDVLLQAYLRAFDTADDVCLVIKTHDNPHNALTKDVARLRATHPDMAPVQILFDELTPAQMRILYEQADLLVAPSRAEGFCLPVAEAVLSGTPVLTTGWSGQRTFAGLPLVQFIDYRFVAAESHLETWNSAWAEPDVDHLTTLLRAAYTAPAPTRDQQVSAQTTLMETHNWQAVAARSVSALQQIAQNPPPPSPLIGWVSTFNTRCGIATYSDHLLQELPDDALIFATKGRDLVKPDDMRITRCWVEGPDDNLDDLSHALMASGVEVVVIQFNYGFFNFVRLSAVINRLKDADRTVVMMMHSTDDAPLPPGRRLAEIVPVLRRCDRLLVHAIHDLNRLKDIGLVDNVALFPHGLPETDILPRASLTSRRSVTLGTYGFFLPQKGLTQLIEATALLRKRGFDVRLNMVNASYPVPESENYIAQARDLIAALEMESFVTMCTEFLKDADSFERLAASDLLVFPYGPTSESASGAVRQALAVGRPVAVTPLSIFDDVDDLVHRLPGFDPNDIAAGLEDLINALWAQDPEGPIARTARNAQTWRAAHGYRALGQRLWHILRSLHRDAQWDKA